MELFLPDQIALSSASEALIKDVGESARRVEEYRPLSAEVVRRIDEELFGERVYSSNAIEGNTLDLRETVVILQEGNISGGRKREVLEAKNLGDAARMITAWGDEGVRCHTIEHLLRVHGTILKGIEDDWAGRFREARVMITGAGHQPPDQKMVPSLVERVLEKVADPPPDVDPIVLATWTHWALARIHPFRDGNGRMSRLWQDIVLLQGGLTCAIIRPEDRRHYLEALSEADEGHFDSLVQLVADRVSWTLDRYFAELSRAQAVLDEIGEIVGESVERVADTRKLSYARWSRKMDILRREFESVASRISEASDEISIEVRPYPMIDQTSWENIRSGLGSKNTWLCVVDFTRSGRSIRYVFFFGRHFWTEGLDNDEERAEPRVCLLISEKVGRGDDLPVRLDQIEGCPLTLREVFVVGNQLVRKRVEASGATVYDRDVPPVRIAMDFLKDVIQRRLT